MLDTRFPRPPGDVGNPVSWPFPVHYRMVAGATVARVVNRALGIDEFLAPFTDALDELVARGARLVTTSCGFLALYQQALQARSPVPVITSSLTVLHDVQQGLGSRQRAGVITIDSRELSERHLRSVGADPDTPIEGVEAGTELGRVIREDLPELDLERAAEDVIAAGRRLRQRVPSLGAVVLECTNMRPYRDALEEVVQVPVHDIVSIVSARYHRQTT